MPTVGIDHRGAPRFTISEAEAERRYHALALRLTAEFPRFRVVRKRDDRLSLAIDRALRVLTLGRMRTYLTHYQTTLGQAIYVTEGWERTPAALRLATLRHEAVHLRQFRRLGWIGMALLYLLVPLPVGLAYFRMRLEREAYEETLRAYHEYFGPGYLRDAGLREHVIAQFTSASYGWMWPFPAALARWYDDFVANLDRP